VPTVSMVELGAPYPPSVVEMIRRLPEPVISLSIMEGWTEGSVFADNRLNPGVVLVWEGKGSANLFVCGRPDRRNAQMVARLLETTVIPGCERKGILMSTMSWNADGWEELVPDVLASRPPIRDRRLLYTLDVSQTDQTDKVDMLDALLVPPEGFEVRAVDAGILDSADIAHADDVRNEILRQWRSLDDFLSRGFGYCLLGDNTITTWCLAEYPAGEEISIGVETVEEYRRRGHATVASAAMIRECIRRGITPYWDLWASNTASRLLAEKVGLEQKAEYPVVFFYHNEIDNMLVNGNAAFRRGKDAATAVRWYNGAFEEARDDAARAGSMLAREGSREWWMKASSEAYAAAGIVHPCSGHTRDTV
jgi:GNAT superfamily N-acetyltransferase